MKENRSFDHLFGRFPGAEGATVGTYDGRRIPLTAPPAVLPTDLPHHWKDGHQDVNDGRMDGFGRAEEQLTVYAHTQMDPDQIPGYWRYAERFVLCDNFFASHLGPTFPNRLYGIAGQAGRTDRHPGAHQRPEGEGEDMGL